jgi:hypothetical protein
MTFDFRRIALLSALMLGLAAPLAVGPASAAAPKARMIPIRIVGFECGDNCYLNYRVITANGRVAAGEPKSALCSVGPCAAWFEQQAMPSKYVGRRARIVLGKGQQVDGDGNVMSTDFPAIKQLVLDPVR